MSYCKIEFQFIFIVGVTFFKLFFFIKHLVIRFLYVNDVDDNYDNDDFKMYFWCIKQTCIYFMYSMPMKFRIHERKTWLSIVTCEIFIVNNELYLLLMMIILL